MTSHLSGENEARARDTETSSAGLDLGAGTSSSRGPVVFYRVVERVTGKGCGAGLRVES